MLVQIRVATEESFCTWNHQKIPTHKIIKQFKLVQTL